MFVGSYAKMAVCFAIIKNIAILTQVFRKNAYPSSFIDRCQFVS